MATKPRKLYDPQIAPERSVVAAKEALLEDQRGTDKITRTGEQYICTSIDGAAEVTSDESVVSRFRVEHGSG